MKKKITTDHSTQSVTLAKKKFDEYHDMFSFRLKPVSMVYIDEIAAKLVDWALNDKDALVLKEFYVLMGINSSDMKRWSERNENLRKAHQFALMVLGIRREKGALLKKLDAGMVASSMAHYDEDWKAMAEWSASLKKNQEVMGDITVVIPPIPEMNKRES